MEKLLNLLQEFYGEDRKFINENGLLTMTNGVVNLSGAYAQTYIISKQGGFIKWLVENNKIDCGTRNPLFITELVGEQEKQMPYSFYEEMLIRLALSDTPIEDLISYLK